MALRLSGRSSQMVAVDPSRVSRIWSSDATLIDEQCGLPDDQSGDTIASGRGGCVNRTYLAVAGLIMVTLVACSDDDRDGSASGTEFCSAAEAAKAAADTQQELFNLEEAPSPDQVQPSVEDFAAKFAAMTAVAPSEISADVGVMNNAAQQLLAVVKSNGYDVVTMIDLPEFATLSDTFASTDYTDAQDSFQSYIETNCGITDNTQGS